MFGTVRGSMNANCDPKDESTRDQAGGSRQAALMRKESVILIEGKEEG